MSGKFVNKLKIVTITEPPIFSENIPKPILRNIYKLYMRSSKKIMHILDIA